MLVGEYPPKGDIAGRKKMVAEHGLPDGVVHGNSAYANWGCRDPICTEAHADSLFEAREDRFSRTEANGGIAPTKAHNRNTHKNWGCKCQECVADWNLYKREKTKAA